MVGPLIVLEAIRPLDKPRAKPEAIVASQVEPAQAVLDLNQLAQAYSIDEADNVRWALARRTPTAGRVYRPETGVDWTALRTVSQTGTLLLPTGFGWSFNEVFQQGPGYKQAAGVLAGGHCALATLFRAAADAAGLPTQAHPHARPIPGFSDQETVNIWWGRDDLVVHNNTAHDLYFVWQLTPQAVTASIEPISTQYPAASLPDWRTATVAMVYGRPQPGGWGSLGQTSIVDQALNLARTYADSVDGWNGGRPVVVAVNPNVAMSGEITQRELYYQYLIAEARRQGYYVMLDVQTGEQPSQELFSALMDKFLNENVWFDWDIEHTAGGRVSAEQINLVAQDYFARRRARGFHSAGLFAVYVFSLDQVSRPAEVRRQYDSGVVIPIFDGQCANRPDAASVKIAWTERVLSPFGAGPYGIMEFETRWGTRYDAIGGAAYLTAFPDALVMVSQ